MSGWGSGWAGGSGGGGAGTVTSVTSTGGTVAITNPGGPIVNIEANITVFYRVVASSSAEAAQKAQAKASGGYVCTGANDETNINQAITDCFNAGNNPLGIVRLVGSSFVIGNGQTTNAGSIKLQTGVYLVGDERWPTVIQAHSSFKTNALVNLYGLTSITTAAAGMIELATGTEQFVGVENLELDGNGNTGNAQVMGVYLNFTGGTPQFSDDAPTLTNLYIYRTAGANLNLLGNVGSAHGRAASVMSIRGVDAGTTVDANVPGVYVALVDSSFHDLNIGSAASHGIQDAGANNRYSNCKSWFAGSLQSTFGTGNGYAITAPRNQLTNCEAQDCFGHGFSLNGNQILSGCQADSCGYPNGHGTAPTGDGFFVSGSGVSIQGAAFDKNESSRGVNMSYGIEFSAASLKGLSINIAVNNTVNGGYNAANVPTSSTQNVILIVPGTFYSGGTAGVALVVLPSIITNLGSVSGTVNLPAAATNPVVLLTMTAATTIKNKTAGDAAPQTVIALQDGVGGHTPTWQDSGGAALRGMSTYTPNLTASLADVVVINAYDGVHSIGNVVNQGV